MLKFDQFISRYGEIGVQALLDNLERHEGVRPDKVLTLEDRWMRLMQMRNYAPMQDNARPQRIAA